MLMVSHRIEWFGLSDVGKKRSANEDAFFVDAGARLGMVADGMGGHQAGEVASSTIAQVFREGASAPVGLAPPERLLRLVTEANARVVQKSQEKSEYRGMGSTITALLFDDGAFHVAQVGDSRAYLLRDGAVLQITEDHTLVQAQINMGVITREQARHSRLKHILTRSMGGHEEVQVDLRQGEARPGDLFLLSSDGFHGELQEGEIQDLLAVQEPLDQKARNLIWFANDRDGSDNITVVLARVLAP
jgi:protein phosphatase